MVNQNRVVCFIFSVRLKNRELCMCGIAGVFAKLDKKIVEQMVNSMSHRGPDNSDF